MKHLLNRFFLFSLLMYVILFVKGSDVWGETWNILLFNIFSFLSYSFILYLISTNQIYSGTKNIKIVVFIYSLFCVLVLNLMFFYHHGDFFQFQTADEIFYHKMGLACLDLNIFDSIQYYLDSYGFDNLGALLYVNLVYRIIASTLFVNFINILCGVLSALLMFKLGVIVMHRKYAMMASVAYFISSFIIKYESSGLKESVFILFVLSAIYFWYVFYFKKKRRYLFVSLLCGLAIMLFRPAVLGMLILSIFIGVFLNRYGDSLKNILLSFLLILAFGFSTSFYTKVMQRLDSFDDQVSLRSGYVKDAASDEVVVYVAAIASTVGPLPNILTREGKENNSLHSSGLLFRGFLGVVFWFSVVFIIKNRVSEMYPFMMMSLLGTVALFYIMESLELRFHLTHLPFTYLVAFYFLSYYDSLKGFARARVSRFLDMGFLGVALLMLYWNFRMI